ncbi:MAG TPA: dual specificity protein phosphatase family protein [Pyrinomonadaceae bacterium]
MHRANGDGFIVRGFGRLIAFVVVTSACAMSATAQDAPRYRELPNFQRVNERLYRGGQPREGGMKKLAELGIKTIINLRDDDRRAEQEATEAERAGLRYFNVPFGNYSRPQKQQLEQVLALIDTHDNQPILVHCKHGADRTGTVVAAYRITRDNWMADEATREAEHYGMSWTQFEMKDFINDYYRHQARCMDVATVAPCVQPKHSKTHAVATASIATRHALAKSYVSTRKGLQRLKKAVL